MTDKETNLYAHIILQDYTLKYNHLAHINLKKYIKKQVKELILDIITYKIEHDYRLVESEKILLNEWMSPPKYKGKKNVKN